MTVIRRIQALRRKGLMRVRRDVLKTIGRRSLIRRRMKMIRRRMKEERARIEEKRRKEERGANHCVRH